MGTSGAGVLRVEAGNVGTATEADSSRPFVSVVVPVLHDVRGIRTCLEALLGQTYPSDRYEIIVADNGSMDGTRTVVEQLRARAGSRLRLVVEDRIRTSYAARNRAIGVARGEVLAFTDADCVPSRTWIERGVCALHAEGATCVGGRIAVTYRGSRPNVYEYWDSASRFNQEAYVSRHYGATANLFVHVQVIERHGPFRAELQSGGDREFGVRLWKAGERIVYAPDAVVDHPARATFDAVYRKSLRIARAHRPLHRLGVAPRSECTLKVFRTLWRCPRSRDWTGRLSLAEALSIRVLHHLSAWLLFAVCYGDGLRTWRPWGLPGRDRPTDALAPESGVTPRA